MVRFSPWFVGGTMSVMEQSNDWRLRAACRGPQSAVFFPPPRFERKEEKRARERQAKDICESCVVVGDCRSHALSRGEQHGIWGGLSENERRSLLDVGL
ncbi:MAG: WhiB family transcriptional regulator [Acidimicrobiales bacterium]